MESKKKEQPKTCSLQELYKLKSNISCHLLYKWIYKRDRFPGIDACLTKKNKRLVIDVEKFDAWLEKHYPIYLDKRAHIVPYREFLRQFEKHPLLPQLKHLVTKRNYLDNAKIGQKLARVFLNKLYIDINAFKEWEKERIQYCKFGELADRYPELTFSMLRKWTQNREKYEGLTECIKKEGILLIHKEKFDKWLAEKNAWKRDHLTHQELYRARSHLWSKNKLRQLLWGRKKYPGLSDCLKVCGKQLAIDVIKFDRWLEENPRVAEKLKKPI